MRYEYGMVLAIACVLVSADTAMAQQTRYYDAKGNSVGTSNPVGQGTTDFYDARGNRTGSATTNSSGTTTFYDSRGNVTGTASGPANGRK